DAGILDILNAQLTYQTAALALVTARAQRYSDTAALFQSLGGGWWSRDAEGTPYPAQRAVCRPPTNPPAPRPWPDSRPRTSPEMPKAQPVTVTPTPSASQPSPEAPAPAP